MENMEISKDFWSGKRILVTGHTGFKGGWLSLWLQSLNANVAGFALKPSTEPNLFQVANIAAGMQSFIGDIRNFEELDNVIKSFQPEIIFHLAAQPLVRYSYENPVETYATNVMGTVHLLEAARHIGSVKAIVNITSDKCYENKEWVWGYRENEPMGGHDPYSNSKGCAELVTSAYRLSYMSENQGIALASARAGNVIGGGDWSSDRLIPDILHSISNNQVALLRSPNAIRPWQHVLEPLNGYLMLAQALYEKGQDYAEAWNFGPEDSGAQTVEWITKTMVDHWGGSASYQINEAANPLHEAHLLKLDCSKARSLLKWHPKWDITQSIEKICNWHKSYLQGDNMRDYCLDEIKQYSNA